MNKDVIIKNENVYVLDYKGNEREITLVDNLDEILIQENVVEIIEKAIVEFENSIRLLDKNKLRDIMYIPAPIISTITLPIIMMYLNTGSLEGIINSKFGFIEKQKFLAFFIAIFMPFGYRMSKNWFQDYNEDIKCKNGKLLVLYQLRSNLVMQSERLNKLRERSKKISIDEEKRYSLSEDVIEIIEEHINLYYELGYNLKEYYKYFRINGCLPDELKEEYNEYGVNIIEEYLKNNGCKIKKK